MIRWVWFEVNVQFRSLSHLLRKVWCVLSVGEIRRIYITGSILGSVASAEQ